MARPSQIYRLELELVTADGAAVNEVLRVALHPSETVERMALRMLAYCYFYQPGISFGRGICMDDEPDVGINDQGYWALWIETGLPRPERLQKIARRADRAVIWVAEDERRLNTWRPSKRDTPKKTVEIMRLAPDSVRQLTTQLESRLNWSVKASPGGLQVCCDGGDEQEVPVVITTL